MNTTTNRAADNIRILAASMVEKAKSGHPGGAMGGADYINVLYSEFLNFDPDDAEWVNRDRFFLDPGHMSPMLYATLSLIGKYSMEDLKNFRQWGSITPGHPEVDVKRGVENTSGPLGQGHAMAVGAAIAERFLVARFGEWMAHKTYAFISDGGIQEEISRGAGRIAGTLGLANLIMFYDSNNIQLSTKVDEVTHEDTAKKYEAWGWQVITIDGNDAAEIRQALKVAQEEKERPTLIIGHTLMGKGAVGANEEDFSNKVSTHGQPLSAAGASFENTVANLGGDPQNPFVIFPDVQEYYAQVLEEKRAQAKQKKAEQAAWEKANPELAAKFHRFMSGEAPAIDYKAIAHKANIATRQASADVLVTLAQEVENMIVSSADLSNSDKTDGFIKGGARNLVKGDFSGKFLQAGVAELTMAAICNGIALHGGIHVAETSVAWKMAMENTETPTALVLSRQNINDLPAATDRYTEALKAEKGAYIVQKNGENPKVILIASGSEVATLIDAAKLLLERKGIASQVVSAISEGLFRQQPTAYQEEVIPASTPHFGLTAGLSVTLEGLVGCNGKIHGVNHFGYSAPAKVLDEKFGFTGEFVYNEICEMLGK